MKDQLLFSLVFAALLTLSLSQNELDETNEVEPKSMQNELDDIKQEDPKSNGTKRGERSE